jgi:protein Mpv17
VQHQLLVVNSMTVLDAAFMSWARNQDDWLGRLLDTWKGEAAAREQQQQQLKEEEEAAAGGKGKAGPKLHTTPLQLPAPGAKH